MRHRRGIRRSCLGAFTVLLLLLAAVGALAFAPVPASAQTVGEIPYIDAVDAWADSESLRRTLPGSSDVTKPSKPKNDKRPKKPSARQLAALRFDRSKEVTQQNDQAVMGLLEPGFDPAAVVAEFDRLRKLVHDGMQGWKGRWSPNNIADVSAYVLLSGYSVYYSRPSVSERGSLAVRGAARNGMALNRGLRRLSGARKQTAAEMLELRTIFRVSGVNVARMAGDATREQAAKAQLRSWIKDVFGVDLVRVKLTRKGLVRR